MEPSGSSKGGGGSKEGLESEKLNKEVSHGGGQDTTNPVVKEDAGSSEMGKTADADRETAEDVDWDHYGPDPNLDDMFEGLNLHGEEEEDLDLHDVSRLRLREYIDDQL